MALGDLPASILQKYEVHEWRHAIAILQKDFQTEYNELISCLDNFVLKKDDIVADGGGKSFVSGSIDSVLYNMNWKEECFDTSILVNGHEKKTPTHSIDCYKNKIAIEVEWNNKTEFYDRDLNNFRLLHERGVVSVGIIITRTTNLQILFNQLGIGASYGSSTTHMDKLVPRIDGGSGGGCPILIFGITPELLDDQVELLKVSQTIQNKKAMQLAKAIAIKEKLERKEQRLANKAKKEAEEKEKIAKRHLQEAIREAFRDAGMDYPIKKLKNRKNKPKEAIISGGEQLSTDL